MSEFLNTGKFAWQIIQANRPVVNTDSDYVNAIPVGTTWGDLDQAAGTNDIEWVWKGPGIVLRDFEYHMQLSWSYGATYRGGGAYIPNAVVTPLSHNVGPGGYQINVSVRIGNIENAGTPTAKVPMIPIDVSLAYTNWIWGGGGTNRFVIYGDGRYSSRWDGDSYEP